MGRPTKLTQEVQDRIVKAVKGGNFLSVAAAYAGINEATLYRWMERGTEDQTGRYCEFREAVTRARAEAQARNIAIVQLAGQGINRRKVVYKQVLNKDGKVITLTETTEEVVIDWHAAAWYLERSFQAEYGLREQVAGEENQAPLPPPVSFVEEDARREA